MNLSYGSRGDDVKKLQKSLNANGYNLAVDGIYGPKTQEAVRKYQQSNGLAADGSGIFGSETSGKLYGTGSTTQNSPTTGQDQQQTAAQTPSFVADPMSNPTYKAASDAYQAALQQGAPQYANPYDEQMNALFDKIMNRGDFSYNLAEDPLYAQYRDQYTQQGQMAMMDTMGQAAALTGGYSNTYGQAVGQQQYNAYLQQLNDIVPELYDRAYGHYQQEGQDLMNQYALTADREADAYNRYMDSYNQYWDNIGFLHGEEDRAYGRGMEADSIGYDRMQDNKAYLLDLMAATGYVPSAEELAAAGMSQGEANAWMNLYAPRGGGGTYTPAPQLPLEETANTRRFEQTLKTRDGIENPIGGDAGMWSDYEEYVNNAIESAYLQGVLSEDEAIVLKAKYEVL
jgi:peptidoglycan hydrolase-like protein with peptidoglycan-binding domain